MDEYSNIEFVEARNAPHDRRVVRGPVHAAGGPHQRTFYPQGYPQHPYFYASPGGGSGGMFGRLSGGQVIDMVAQIFAALMPLPAAPAVTGDADTDSGNEILYHTALATYAKRDEQVRTVGNLLVKLVG